MVTRHKYDRSSWVEFRSPGEFSSTCQTYGLTCIQIPRAGGQVSASEPPLFKVIDENHTDRGNLNKLESGAAERISPEEMWESLPEGLVVKFEPSNPGRVHLAWSRSGTSSWRAGRGATAAAFVLVLLATSLALSSVASGNGALPVPPNPSSAYAHTALAATSPTQFAYVETVRFSQLIQPSTTSCGGGCLTLWNAYANVTNPLSGMGSAVTPSNGTYLIQLAAGCPGSCPSYSVVCDGTLYGGSPTGYVACYSLRLEFFGVTGISKDPTYNVTRTQEFIVHGTDAWVGSATGATFTGTVESWPASIYGNLSHLKFTSWSVPEVSWAVPLPSGSFALAGTAVEFLNTSTFLTSSQFVVESTWVLLQWTQFPSSSCFACFEGAGASHLERLSYLFELEYSGAPVVGSGGILSPITANSTSPPNLPAPYTVNPTVVVSLANVSLTSPGNYTSLTFWKNPSPVTYGGPWVISSTWWIHAQNVTVIVNGRGLGSGQYGNLGNAIQIYPGEFAVPNGSSAVFEISFQYTAVLDPLAPLFILTGHPVTVGDVVIALALVGAGLLALAEYASPAKSRVRSSIESSSEGVLLLVAVVLAMLYL